MIVNENDAKVTTLGTLWIVPHDQETLKIFSVNSKLFVYPDKKRELIEWRPHRNLAIVNCSKMREAVAVFIKGL